MYNFGPWKFFEWKFAPTIWIPRLFAGDGSKSTAGLKVLRTTERLDFQKSMKTMSDKITRVPGKIWLYIIKVIT